MSGKITSMLLLVLNVYCIHTLQILETKKKSRIFKCSNKKKLQTSLGVKQYFLYLFLLYRQNHRYIIHIEHSTMEIGWKRIFEIYVQCVYACERAHWTFQNWISAFPLEAVNININREGKGMNACNEGWLNTQHSQMNEWMKESYWSKLHYWMKKK